MWCTGGAGLSGAAARSRGSPNDTRRPVRTSVAAAATRAGVSWSSPPRPGRSPPLFQVLTCRYSSRNCSRSSCPALGRSTVPVGALIRRRCAPVPTTASPPRGDRNASPEGHAGPVPSVEIYAPSDKLGEVRSLLATRDGVDHVMVRGTSVDGRVLVTAELTSRIVDALLPELVACGVPGDEISIVHRDSQRPVATPNGNAPAWGEGTLAWSELAIASRQYARAVPLYLAFMACAGVIADFGVLTRSSILVVGAMALSPDLLPLCATCVGIAEKHPRLAGRAFTALAIGLAVAGVAAFVVTALLRMGGYPPANGSLGDGGLGVLPTVNVATLVVAAVAGVAGVLAFSTRSSVVVGVAISITTIPAAAFIGAAVAVGDAGLRGALAVLAANVGLILLTGTATLAVQRLRQGR